MKHGRRMSRIIAILLTIVLSLGMVNAGLATIGPGGSDCPNSPDGSGDHSWIQKIEEANCVHGIVEHWTCENCGKTSDVEYGEKDPYNHNFVDDYKEATCTEDGYSRLKCTRCGATQRETVIPAKGHVPETVPGKDPTCTEAGWTDGEVCSRCGAVLRPAASINPLGHDWDSGVVTKEATETEEGIITYTCKRDPSHTKTETIPKKNTAPTKEPEPEPAPETHTPEQVHEHNWDKKLVEKEGNCVTRTMYRYICTGCGAEKYEYGEYGPHDWGEWETVKEPTASEAGIRRRVCRIDPSHVEEEEIPPRGEEPAPSLSLSVSQMPGHEQGIFQMEDLLYLRTTVTNTGNVTLYHINYYFPEGAAGGAYTLPLAPGESTYIDMAINVVNNDNGYFKVGRVAVGYYKENDTGIYDSFADGSSKGSSVVSNEDWLRVPLSLGESPKSAYLELLTGPEAGIGKRYVGADLPLRFRATNTSEIPIMVQVGVWTDLSAPNGTDGGWAPLNPGESISFVYHNIISAEEEAAGVATIPSDEWWLLCYPEDAPGKENMFFTNDVIVQIPLTYPDDAVPEDPHPQLTLVHTGDSDPVHAPAKELLTEYDSVFADYICYNNGNVPLTLQLHASGGAIYDLFDTSTVYYPGESLGNHGCGYSPVSDHLTPGTDTAELLGTATISFYFTGHDPVTGEELCQSNTISRTWKVKRPEPEAWSIPSESILTVDEVEWTVPSNPGGYVLGEFYQVRAHVVNVGPVDVKDDITLYLPTRDLLDPYGKDMPVGESVYWYVDEGYVTQEDIDNGGIYFPPVTLTWTDPVSNDGRWAVSNGLLLPVIDNPGLVLHKSVKTPPANGQYYDEGETIEWEITVSNPTDRTYTSVTVYDLGMQIAFYDEFAPGMSVTVEAPAWTVDEYDIAIGYVSNIADASGYDAGGAHNWFSNQVTVPAGANSQIQNPTPDEKPDPIPAEDPLSPVIGQKVGAAMWKTELSVPANGMYYTEGEDIVYQITVRNTGETDLDSITLYDSLWGLVPVSYAGFLPAGQETNFTYTHTVDAWDVETGYVVNYAAAEYTFNGGTTGTPIVSNKVTSLVSATPPHVPETGVIDPGKLPGDPETPTMVPVTTPDGTPVELPDGTPVLAPEGTTPVLDPDGKPLLTGDGYPVLKLPDGTYCVPDKDGKLIRCDETGKPIYKPDGSYVYVTYGSGPASCEIRLNTLGEAEGGYTLHACAAHSDAAKAAEAAAADGTADGWKKAQEIWCQEIDILYQNLYDAADSTAKAAVINDRATFISYVNAYEAMMLSLGDEAAAEKAVTELLRMQCAELCAMVRTVPARLPDSLKGSYRRMLSSAPAEKNSRTIGALNGNDSELQEVFDANGSRTLQQVIELAGSAKSRTAQVNAFTQAQRLWQLALDQVVNTRYRAADKETRQKIGVCRVMLDQLYSTRKSLMEALYSKAPEVGAEALSNLYKNALINMSK